MNGWENNPHSDPREKTSQTSQRPPRGAGLFFQPVPVFCLCHRPALSQGLSRLAVSRARPARRFRHGHHHAHGVHGAALEPAADSADPPVWADFLQLDLPLRHSAPRHRLAPGQAPRGGARADRGEPLQAAVLAQIRHSHCHDRRRNRRHAANRLARPHLPVPSLHEHGHPADDQSLCAVEHLCPAIFPRRRVGHRLHAAVPGGHECGHPALFLPGAMPARRLPRHALLGGPLAD